MSKGMHEFLDPSVGGSYESIVSAGVNFRKTLVSVKDKGIYVGSRFYTEKIRSSVWKCGCKQTSNQLQ